MPRMARIKSFDAVYHIMAKSISEVELFKTSDDKAKYLSFVKKYQEIYQFRVYSYCLMDNHLHLMIDANGADISRIMHCINFKYAQYFNKVHKRHGHLFQDRFKSKIVANDSYLMVLSAYIHNNVMDLKGYENKPQDYFYSSLGIYLGLRKDPFELIDDSFVLSFFGNKTSISRPRYLDFVMKCCSKSNLIDIEFEEEGTEYRSGRTLLVRDFKLEDIVDYIAGRLNVSRINLHVKNSKGLVEAKSLLALFLRSLCNARCSDICRVLGNITQARVSALCSMGAQLIKDERYQTVMSEFIECYS